LKHRNPDVLIVGSGLIGAIFARLLVESGLHVVMVEAGANLSQRPGEHLLNSYLHHKDPEQYHSAVSARLHLASIPVVRNAQSRAAVFSSYNFSNYNPEQNAKRNLPAAALCYAVGGMGTVWSGLVPRLEPSVEPSDVMSQEQWESAYQLAEKLLAARSDQFESSLRQSVIRDFLLDHYRGGEARPAPVAARRVPGSRCAVHWTGPADVLDPLLRPDSAGKFQILSEHIVSRLAYRRGKVLWADVHALKSATRRQISAGIFVVAGGGTLTPQLLWNSGILKEDDSPLGRYLMDHPIAFARVALGPEIVDRVRALTGKDKESRLSDDLPVFLSVPLRRDRPFLSFILQEKMDLRGWGGRVDPRMVVNLYWYAIAHPQRRNRVTFSQRYVDTHGMPKPIFDYRRGSAERDRTAVMVEDLRQVGSLLGTFLQGSPPQILSPGSSMHVMGTVRAGRSRKGDAVADEYGRVWGLSNLFVGGTGLIGWPTATNPTLTAAALATRGVGRILGS